MDLKVKMVVAHEGARFVSLHEIDQSPFPWNRKVNKPTHKMDLDQNDRHAYVY